MYDIPLKKKRHLIREKNPEVHPLNKPECKQVTETCISDVRLLSYPFNPGIVCIIMDGLLDPFFQPNCTQQCKHHSAKLESCTQLIYLITCLSILTFVHGQLVIKKQGSGFSGEHILMAFEIYTPVGN